MNASRNCGCGHPRERHDPPGGECYESGCKCRTFIELAPLDLDAIEARAAAATAGPWEPRDELYPGAGRFEVANEEIPQLITSDGDGIGAIPVWADAAFIAAARRDVPALVAEVRRLEMERGALVERLQLMAGAEREGARESVARAVAYETAAELVAGGSPL